MRNEGEEQEATSHSGAKERIRDGRRPCDGEASPPESRRPVPPRQPRPPHRPQARSACLCATKRADCGGEGAHNKNNPLQNVVGCFEGVYFNGLRFSSLEVSRRRCF